MPIASKTHRTEDTAELPQTYISMRTLKSFVEKIDSSSLKDAILAQPDQISSQDFQAILPILLQLLKKSYE